MCLFEALTRSPCSLPDQRKSKTIASLGHKESAAKATLKRAIDWNLIVLYLSIEPKVHAVKG